jgi:magnesium chelatase family protein
MGKISGPLVDRVDIHIEVPAVPFRELSGGTPGTSSAEMRAQVVAARATQTERFRGTTTRYNADMSHRQTRACCVLDEECSNILKAAMAEMGLSARAHDKILRVARTLADLEPNATIRPHHLNEAVNYRMLDRNLWT